MDLNKLFSPRSIAVIGASTRQGSVGYTLTENLLKNGYAGEVYPVNPKTDTLFGLPCYRNISDIGRGIDLAIIIVPAAIVPQVLRESGAKGVKAAIIISSGFKETGAAGKKLEDELASIAKESGIALLGPNCLGFLRPSISLNASFAKHMPAQGSIAFFSQSGALCTALLDLTAGELGFSHFVSTGNKAVIDENELLRFFAQDDDTKAIGLYAEDLADSGQLIGTGRAILSRSQAKPVVALKSGTTTAGTQASSSHTGALAGSDQAYQALFKQARMVRAESLEHLFDLLKIFSQNPLPNGNRLAIVTNAGGLGVLATDAAVSSGLELAKLSSETEKKLKVILPPAASSRNPIDVLGDALADRYRAALDLAAADDQADMLLVIVTPQTMTEAHETAQAIADTKNKSSKPVVAVFAGKESLEEGLAVLRKNNVSTVLYPEAGARALAALAQVAKWRKDSSATPFSFDNVDRERAAAIISQAKAAGRTQLYETEAADILKAYGFPFLKTAFIRNVAEAETAIRDFSGRVALKIVSPDIVHKSDVGGVLLDIAPEHIGKACRKLLTQVKTHVPEARLEGALIVEMAQTGGREIILGMKQEPGLGSLVMAGLGGIFVETSKDVVFRFTPMTQEDAREMIQELKSLPLLEGARGQQGIDMPALVDSVGRLAQLVRDFPEIAELDINPILAFPDGDDFRVLDARIRLKN